jgi:antagonist of KipI
MSPPAAEGAALTVVRPGLWTLVVDFGRPGCRSLGVPVGGAADRASLALGNALVGNPPDAAALEVCLAGPTLRAGAELACVLFGAPFEMHGGRRPLTAGTTFTLHAGEEVHVVGTPRGARAYFCVRGGLRTPVVLGSRSAFEPLRAGAVLPCVPGRIPGRRIPLAAESFPAPGTGPVTLRVLDGPQADWFRGGEFHGASFTVTPASNRMGLRLRGAPLAVPARELVSEPVCPGSVQVTADGQCIVLGADGQTIGGYPKIAQVIAADLDALGQLRPGDAVAFAHVALPEAERCYRERQAALDGWLLRVASSQ